LNVSGLEILPENGPVLSRFILGQISRDYQFIPMPKIPGQPGEMIGRALAIRRLFGLIKLEPHAFIGMAPETYYPETFRHTNWTVRSARS
jgi:hypothetical protein